MSLRSTTWMEDGVSRIATGALPTAAVSVSYPGRRAATRTVSCTATWSAKSATAAAPGATVTTWRPVARGNRSASTSYKPVGRPAISNAP